MVAHCTVNNVLTYAIIDTGAYRTIMDVGMARMLGLTVRPQQGGDCGTYSVPGTGQTNVYAGIVDGIATIKFAPGVAFAVKGLKLINHPHPLLLVGGDLVAGGRGDGAHNFTGILIDTDEAGKVAGAISFAPVGGASVKEPLVNVPSASGSHALNTSSLCYVGPPAMGGQCLRRVA